MNSFRIWNKLTMDRWSEIKKKKKRKNEINILLFAIKKIPYLSQIHVLCNSVVSEVSLSFSLSSSDIDFRPRTEKSCNCLMNFFWNSWRWHNFSICVSLSIGSQKNSTYTLNSIMIICRKWRILWYPYVGLWQSHIFRVVHLHFTYWIKIFGNCIESHARHMIYFFVHVRKKIATWVPKFGQNNYFQ